MCQALFEALEITKNSQQAFHNGTYILMGDNLQVNRVKMISENHSGIREENRWRV